MKRIQGEAVETRSFFFNSAFIKCNMCYAQLVGVPRPTLSVPFHIGVVSVVKLLTVSVCDVKCTTTNLGRDRVILGGGIRAPLCGRMQQLRRLNHTLTKGWLRLLPCRGWVKVAPWRVAITRRRIAAVHVARRRRQDGTSLQGQSVIDVGGDGIIELGGQWRLPVAAAHERKQCVRSECGGIAIVELKNVPPCVDRKSGSLPRGRGGRAVMMKGQGTVRE